ncbi:SOSS complex subunit C homolog [Oppia nitens]|uniref:SOSS complex subunit C homolog n=1 Tax=Oppia nitens TaxID=1686743 RepID=UPI0023DA40FE|nr:SOSS complex subunit C homolog [Oppia nitens]
MPFQMPNQRQELQRNKILEDIQKKQQMLKQQSIGGQPVTSSQSPTGSTQPLLDTASTSGSTSSISSAQRSALNHANNNSFGYFITQDSSFGNLILPVLPRF